MTSRMVSNTVGGVRDRVRACVTMDVGVVKGKAAIVFN